LKELQIIGNNCADFESNFELYRQPSC